jgi:transposase
MARKRMTVRRIREILRLHFEEKRSNREVGASVGKSASVICDCLKRFAASGLSWPFGEEVGEEELERRMYAAAGSSGRTGRVEPDFEQVHRELKRKGVTLQLLWEEYRAAHGEAGYRYSRFCERYREWSRPLGAVLRQEHKAGDKTFVDWSGDGIELADRVTGEVWEAPLFVAVLGASGYVFAKCAPSREAAHWLRLHDEAFEHFGGVTAAVVPDNEKTGVRSACRYDPDLNPTYAAWAEHNETAVFPARPGKARDKAKVENAVLNAQRWILAKLRNHVFFGLAEANEEIAVLVDEYNERPLQQLEKSRRELYETIDRPALRPLPARRFEPFSWSKVTVNIDYHVVVEKHHYSAPYTLIGQKLEARWTGSTVELFHKGRRVASHPRGPALWGWTTAEEHRPEKHRAHLAWTPERITSWAEKTGPQTALLAARILGAKRYPEQGYRACLGVLRLGQKYGDERLEAACARANVLSSSTYHTVRSILEHGSDRLPLPEQASRAPTQLALPRHENIRGPDYYH